MTSARRHFSPQYKLRVVREADSCGPGEVGKLLEREGLHYSHLAKWRQIKERGELEALAPRKRGPRPQAKVASEELEAIRAELQQLENEVRDLRNLIGNSESLAHILLERSDLVGETRIATVESLAGVLGVKTACQIVGIPRSTFYRQRPGL